MARLTCSRSSPTSIESSGTSAASRLAHARVVSLCGGNITSVVVMGRHYRGAIVRSTTCAVPDERLRIALGPILILPEASHEIGQLPRPEHLTDRLRLAAI